MEIVERRSMRIRLWYATAWHDIVLIGSLPPKLSDIGEPTKNQMDRLAFWIPAATFSCQFGFELPHKKMVLVDLPMGYEHGITRVIGAPTGGEATGPVGELPTEEEEGEATKRGLRSPCESEETTEGEAGAGEASQAAASEEAA